jgi:hypothetical protein
MSQRFMRQKWTKSKRYGEGNFLKGLPELLELQRKSCPLQRWNGRGHPQARHNNATEAVHSLHRH